MSAEALRERDGDDCSLCGLPVPKDAVRPHPLAPEVDHVLPISRGGTHDPENLALAHKTCNITKGNKPARWKRNPPDEVAPLLAEWEASGMIPTRTECSVDDCDRRAESYGMCQKHRRRFLKHGTTELPPKPTICSEDGCTKPIRARGLCKPHYQRGLNRGKTCSEDGCEKESNTRGGLCKPHYNRWLRDRPART